MLKAEIWTAMQNRDLFRGLVGVDFFHQNSKFLVGFLALPGISRKEYE
jgi:hypothetical protein